MASLVSSGRPVSYDRWWELFQLHFCRISGNDTRCEEKTGGAGGLRETEVSDIGALHGKCYFNEQTVNLKQTSQLPYMQQNWHLEG